MPRNRYIWFASTALIGCVADLLSKAYFFTQPELYGGRVAWLWTGHVGVQLSWNRGALFGLGQGGTWLFAGLSVVAALAIVVWLFRFGAARDLWITLALGCVTAGILGNLYDRVGLPDRLWPGRTVDAGQPVHAVRDWILVQWDDRWVWPNFNIADSLLVAGAIALVVEAARRPKPGEDAAAEATGETARH